MRVPRASRRRGPEGGGQLGGGEPVCEPEPPRLSPAMRRRAPRKVSQTTRGLAPGTRCPRLGTASHTWIPMVCCRRGCASVSASHSHVWLRSRSHGWLRVWPLEGIVNRDKRRLVFLCRSLLVWQAAWAASACTCLIVHLHLRVHLHLQVSYVSTRPATQACRKACPMSALQVHRTQRPQPTRGQNTLLLASHDRY